MTYNVTPICYCSFDGEFDWMTAFYKKVEIVENYLREIKQEKICFIELENNGKNNLVLVRDLLGRYEVRNLSDKIMKNELMPKDFKKVSKKEFKKIIIKLEEKYILKIKNEISRIYKQKIPLKNARPEKSNQGF